jgi:Zn-dependent protease with chaperone function
MEFSVTPEIAVNDEEFRWLVTRLETQSANGPRAFRLKVLAISVGAYAALFAGLLANVLLLYGAVAYGRAHGVNRAVVAVGFLGVMALPMCYVTLRTLLMRVPAPDGLPLARGDAPVLFDLLDKMRARLDGPPIHHVLVNRDYNACIAQRPRWGLVGPSVNYLVLGLPFLYGQGTSEMLAVVAHEYGHLCGAHGRIGAWIGRQRLMLAAVHARVEAAGEASIWYALLDKALGAFMPYFTAHVFVLTRQDEYEADRTAARLAGAAATASSLIRSSLLAQWFGHEFWATLYRQADTRDRPAILPYQSMGTAFRISQDEWATDPRLKAAWQCESDVDDTHPCLRERVEALGQQAALPKPLVTSAAASLLGPLATRLATEFDQAWWRDEAKDWGERHRRVVRAHGRLRELGAQPQSSLATHELQEMALLKAEFESAQ